MDEITIKTEPTDQGVITLGMLRNIVDAKSTLHGRRLQDLQGVKQWAMAPIRIAGGSMDVSALGYGDSNALCNAIITLFEGRPLKEFVDRKYSAYYAEDNDDCTQELLRAVSNFAARALQNLLYNGLREGYLLRHKPEFDGLETQEHMRAALTALNGNYATMCLQL